MPLKKSSPGALRLSTTALALIGAFALASCGGGGGGSTTSSDFTSVQVAGHVIDGPISGARVFLDLNGNLALDAGEPESEPTGADGAFTLVTGKLTQAQLATAKFISHVPDTARDADDGGLDLLAAGRRGFTLMTPASAYLEVANGRSAATAPLLTPLTTLVAAEMAFNGRSLAQARQTVQEQVSLGSRDPMVNFVATGDSGLGAKARAIAIALGEYGKSIADGAQTDGGISRKDQAASTVAALKTALPSVLARVPTGGANAPVPAGEVVDNLPPVEPGFGVTSASDTQEAGSAPIKRKFVVVFKDSVGNPAAAAQQAVGGRGGEIGFTYGNVFKGFSVSLPDAAADAFVQAMSNNPNVDRVEVDIPMTVTQTTQSSATWGLDRTDQRDLPLSGSYTYGANGSGVRAYIVDTGILAGHTDFGGRVSGGYTAIADGYGTSDCNGHGTHVAGTVGGATWGMAKGVSLVPVRVLACDGSGSLSGVIAGLDWIAANATLPAVVNMSLGGGASSTLDSAVAKVVAKGITVAVAAGNENQNACNVSPAREPSALTVGATASNDSRASYSNFGSCLDVFAPGSSIKSAWYTSSTATNTISGTSMASPHVAGLAALLLQATPGATPAQVAESIKSSATPNKVTSAGTGSPNLLVFAAASSGSTTEPVAAASVKISSLTGSGQTVRNGWRAIATVTVKNASDVAVSGAVVKGDFTVGGTGLSCTTGTNGVCSIRSGTLGKSLTATTFAATSVTGTNMTYDSAGSTTSVTIQRP